MKINLTPRLKTVDPRLYELLRDLAVQVNGLSEGRLTATYNAYTAAPTTGTWGLGDFIRNSQPSVVVHGSHEYILHGWMCVSAGTPGTWKECYFHIDHI
jgi:hypothetical protein